MKKWTKVLGLAGMTLVFSMTLKANASAEQMTGIVQTAGARYEATIQWNEVPNAFRYEYTLKDSVTGEEKTGVSYNVKTAVNNLKPGKTYLFTVHAEGNSGRMTDLSDPIEVVTAPDTQKFSISQSGSTANSVTMTAAGVDDANYYVVKQGENIVAYSDNPSAITVTGLYPNTPYEYNVFPARRSAAGFIAEGLFKTCAVQTRDWNGEDTRTPAENEFWISERSQTEDAYTFTVLGTTASSGYELQIQDMNGNILKSEKTSSMLPIVVRNIGMNGSFWKYHVRTYAKAGSEEKFSEWSPYRYEAGTLVKASVKKEKKALTVSWDAVKGAKNYIVYASTSEKSGFKKVKSVTGKSLKVTKVAGKALKKKKKYYFRIEAYAEDGGKQIKSTNTYTLSATFS